MEASAAILLDLLGAEAGCCQEDLTSSRKSGNAGKDGGVKVCAGLKTDLHCSELAFQGTWRKLAALSISARNEFDGSGISASEASLELGGYLVQTPLSRATYNRKQIHFKCYNTSNTIRARNTVTFVQAKYKCDKTQFNNTADNSDSYISTADNSDSYIRI
ncbi:UNVERIFIED_CONTAM: hypothetical protein FKN15_035828 [Acipenser sinensis]